MTMPPSRPESEVHVNIYPVVIPVNTIDHDTMCPALTEKKLLSQFHNRPFTVQIP